MRRMREQGRGEVRQASVDMSYIRHAPPSWPSLSVRTNVILRENVWVAVWTKTRRQSGTGGGPSGESVAVSVGKEGTAWRPGCKRRC